MNKTLLNISDGINLSQENVLNLFKTKDHGENIYALKFKKFHQNFPHNNTAYFYVLNY